MHRRRCAWASGVSTPNERLVLAERAGWCCAVCITLSIAGWSACASMDGGVPADSAGRNWVCNVRWRTYRPAAGRGSASQQPTDARAASQATNGTRAAHTASKAKCHPGRGEICTHRVLSVPIGPGWQPRGHHAVTWETACRLFATEPFTQPEDAAGYVVPTCRAADTRRAAHRSPAPAALGMTRSDAFSNLSATTKRARQKIRAALRLRRRPLR